MNDPPDTFDTYWRNVTEEVAALRDVSVEVEELPLRTNEVSTAYGVRFSGIGGYPLFAFLTVPRGDGPFPAVMQAPPYGSVVAVPAYERRARYVVLALCHRGQRLSDSLYSAAYPGLLTDGLPDPLTYRWREIVADCLRGLDVLGSRPETDTSRLAVTGNDLAAITAALRPEVRYLLVGSMLFRGASDSLSEMTEYPAREFADYVRCCPDDEEQVGRTLALFDPLAFARMIEAETLLTCGEGEVPLVQPLADRTAGKVELRVNTGKGYLDHGYEERWLKRRMV